jgi:hypothetical protein
MQILKYSLLVFPEDPARESLLLNYPLFQHLLLGFFPMYY